MIERSSGVALRVMRAASRTEGGEALSEDLERSMSLLFVALQVQTIIQAIMKKR